MASLRKKPKPTPDPYFMDGFPPAEGFGGYNSKTDKLIPMRKPPIKKGSTKKAPIRSVKNRGGK